MSLYPRACSSMCLTKIRRPKVSRLSERISRIEQLLADNLRSDQISGIVSVQYTEEHPQTNWQKCLETRLNLLKPTQRPAAPQVTRSFQTHRQCEFTLRAKSWVSSVYSQARRSSFPRDRNGSKLAPDNPLQWTSFVQNEHLGIKSGGKPSTLS